MARPSNWSSGQAISADKLNAMMDYTAEVASEVANHDNRITNLSTRISNAETAASNASTAAGNAASIATAAQQAINTAKSPKNSLSEKLQDIIDTASNQASTAATNALRTAKSYTDTVKGETIAEIDNAIGVEVRNARINNTTSTTYNNLALHMAYIDSNLSSVLNTKAQVDAAISGYTSLNDHFNAVETNINSNIDNKVSTSVDAKLTDVNVRLNYLDGGSNDTNSKGSHKVRITELEKQIIDEPNINGLSSNIKSDVRDLKNQIIYNPSAGNTNIKSNVETLLTEVNAAHRNNNDTLDNRFDNIDYEISHPAIQGDNTTGIKERLTEAETNIQTIANELGMISNEAIQDTNTRIDNITDEILEAHVQTGLDTQNNPIYQYEDLNERFSAVEQKANAAAVAEEIDEVLEGLNTRLDAIDGGESSEGDSLISRVDSLEEIMGDSNNGLIQQINTLQNTIEDNTNGLSATKTIADNAMTAISHAAEGNDPGGLTQRIETLETKDTIIISVNDFEALNPNTDSTVNTNADYIVGPDDNDKYIYYRFIQNENENWVPVMISGNGAGGTGSNNAIIVNVLPTEDIDINTDYYLQESNGYSHYRYDETNGWILLSPALDSTINSKVNTNSAAITALQGQGRVTAITGTGTPNSNGYYTLNVTYAGNENAEQVNIKAPVTITSITQSQDLQTLTITNSNGDESQINLPAGGGGSGTSNGSLGIVRVTNQSVQTLIGAEDCNISFRVVAKDAIGQDITQSGTAILYVNNEQRTTFSISSIYGEELDEENNPLRIINTINVMPYLATGVNTVRIQVRMNTGGETDSSASTTWSVNVINFYLTWNYDESTVQSDSTIRLQWQPFGTNLTKTTHILVDNVEVATRISTRSGSTETIDLDNVFTHGSHLVTMYMTATINSINTTSAAVNHSIIIVKTGNNTPIISTSLSEITMTQYNTLKIPYTVYTPGSMESIVTRYVDGVLVSTDTGIDRTTHQWNYTPSVATEENEPHILRITSGITSVEVRVNVEPLNISDIQEIEGYDLKLKASDITSNSALQNWKINDNDNSTKLQFSENFDWVNGGIKTEELIDGTVRQYINVRAGNTLTIPYKPFATDVKSTGLTVKIIFKVTRCSNYDATAINCCYTSDNSSLGFKLNAHNASLITSAQTVSTQYGEDEYTELEFEVYKQDAGNANYAMVWLDGVMASARDYQNANFSQGANATDIVIGSADCDVQIYLIKIYKTHLSIEDHLANFIADAPNAAEMIARYNRNDILDESNEINYEKLVQQNPSCRVWLYDINRMTIGKKDQVDVYNFDQIYLDGNDTITNHLHGAGKLTVQGTSSVNYRKGAANTDIKFTQLTDRNGNDLLANEIPGFKITESSVPITYANMKVNFASCEQVNNMCNAEWYQRYQPFPSLSPRDCMQFAMGVQFIRDHGEGEQSGEEILFARERGATITDTGTYDPNNRGTFDPDKYYMYSIGNLGNSKKNTHVFHNENECCIEVMENTTRGERMLEWPATMDWTGKIKEADHSFEIRYCEEENETMAKTGWQRFIEWMAQNNPNAATGNALPEPVTFGSYTFKGHNRTITPTEGRNFAQVLRGTSVTQYAGTYTNDTFNYRMAKMLSECENYLAMDSVVYHFCYIERHTMVDNVAKNTFWSSVKEVGGPNNEEGFWIWNLSKNYDNDTSDGNDNNGQLVFDYGNEAADRQNDKTVFNGADSVWFVFISNLYEACQEMFINRESLGAWNSISYHNYLTSEQKKIPERVWNQCYWYDYLRTYELAKNAPNAEELGLKTDWINFLDGGQKIHQRSHYETYQEIYDASKYISPFSTNQALTIRGENVSATGALAQKTDFYIQMYNKCYLTIHVGAEYQTRKCEKGQQVTISFKDSSNNPISLSNSVINIDSGSMVQTIGDLSLIYPSSISFGPAKRLRILQIGSDIEGYNNPNMNANSAIVLNNPLLKELYVQNLGNATYGLDLTSCPELEKLKANGSAFTSYIFANGGKLKEAILEAPTDLVMRNLDYLTNEKFVINDYSKLTQLWLENCDQFDDKAFIESATALGIIRLTGIAWTEDKKLTNTNILDTLLTMQGLNSLGQGIDQSYLQGTIRIESPNLIAEQLIDRYKEIWPDLNIDIDSNNIQRQIHVIFINTIPEAAEDDQQNVSYVEDTSSNRILYETYIDANPGVATHIFGENGLHEDPASNPNFIFPSHQDIRYNYTFGTQTNGVYRTGSGWITNLTSKTPINFETDTFTWSEINQEMKYYACYKATYRRYTVRWWGASTTNPVAFDNNVIYGAAAKFPITTATYPKTNIDDNGRIQVFRGWDRSTSNITEDTDVYSLWSSPARSQLQIADYISTNHTLTGLDPQDLYTYAQIAKTGNIDDATCAAVLDDSRFEMVMGNDFEFNNVRSDTIFDVDHPRYFKRGGLGSEARYPVSSTDLQIQPFKLDSEGKSRPFTLVIDFKFDSINDEGVLMSCFDKPLKADGTIDQNTGRGFQLIYNALKQVPVVTWGTISSGGTTWNAADSTVNGSNNSVKVGHAYNGAHSRNIVVLRYPGNGSTILYVYYDYDENGTAQAYSDKPIKVIDLHWEGATKAILEEDFANTVLKFGYSYKTGDNYNNSSSGTIYWAKIWYDDLGDDNCKQLAAWPRERITMKLTGIYNSGGEYITLPTAGDKYKIEGHPNLQFTAVNLLQGVGHSINNPEYGWEENVLKIFLNDKFYNGIPFKWRSVIMNSTLTNSQVHVVFNGNFPDISINPHSFSTYIYIPAYGEYITNGSSAEQNTIIANESKLKRDGEDPIEHIIDANGNVESGVYYPEDLRIKFKFFTIPSDAHYYAIKDNSLNAGTATLNPFDPHYPNKIKRGDIWLREIYREGNSYANTLETNAEAYIFIDLNDIELYHPLIKSGYECINESGELVGAWFASNKWPLRTSKVNMSDGLTIGAEAFNERGTILGLTKSVSFADGICIGFAL